VAEWERVIQAAMTKHAKGASNETMQKSVLLGMLKDRGRISYNESGKDMDWKVKYKQITLEATSDMEAYTFQRHNLYKTFTLDWRGARMGDVISEKERLMIRNKEALISIWAPKADILREDAVDQLNKWMYYDGNATGYTKCFHGLASIFGYTAASTSLYAAANDTYGGQTLNAKHGTEADATAYSPHLVNEGATEFGSWTSNPTKVMRYLVSATTVKNAAGGRPDIALTTESRYNVFKDSLASEEQYVVDAKDITKLSAGFQGVRYDGLDLTWDYDYNCTGGLGTSTVALNLSKIKLRLLTKQLFVGDSSYDIDRHAYLFDLVTWGNLEINPRYQGKSADFSS
jgi:hypothetical protein